MSKPIKYTKYVVYYYDAPPKEKVVRATSKKLAEKRVLNDHDVYAVDSVVKYDESFPF